MGDLESRRTGQGRRLASVPPRAARSGTDIPPKWSLRSRSSVPPSTPVTREREKVSVPAAADGPETVKVPAPREFKLPETRTPRIHSTPRSVSFDRVDTTYPARRPGAAAGGREGGVVADARQGDGDRREGAAGEPGSADRAQVGDRGGRKRRRERLEPRGGRGARALGTRARPGTPPCRGPRSRSGRCSAPSGRRPAPPGRGRSGTAPPCGGRPRAACAGRRGRSARAPARPGPGTTRPRAAGSAATRRTGRRGSPTARCPARTGRTRRRWRPGTT